MFIISLLSNYPHRASLVLTNTVDLTRLGDRLDVQTQKASYLNPLLAFVKMGSDKAYDRDEPRRRKHRHDDEYDESSDRGHASKRTHRRSPDRHAKRERSRDRDADRRRSQSPGSRRQRSRDRHSRRDRRDRDSRSPKADSHSHRRSRKSRDGSEDEAKDSDRRRRRRHSRSAGSQNEDEGIERRQRRHRGSAPLDEDSEAKQIVRRGGPLPSQADSFAVSKGEEPEKPKEKPNFGNTGHLAAASNSVTQVDGTTVTLKYHEPPEARKPPARDQWKLFVFKGSDVVDTIDLSNRSCWLVGRETAVVDLLAEHPSISKQHAVVQFRYTEKRNEYGDKIGKVKPYLIDLESANGTELNGEKVPDRRYLELRPKDVVKFGSSTREYVVMLSRD